MDPLRNFGFVLKDVSQLYRRLFEERAQGLGLTLAQCRTLVMLEKNEGISQKRLAELTEVEPMSLVRILDRMEADGWVERRSDPEDRRARSLRLTAKAKAILDDIGQVSARVRGEALHGLSDADRTLLLLLLERVHANLLRLKPSTPEMVGATAALPAARTAR